MKRQRVLIIRNAYPQDTGGAEQYAFNLALALKRAGHVPIVVTKHAKIREKCRAESIKSILGIWYEKQEWNRLYYFRFYTTSLWYMWLILRYRIEVVHPQSRDDFVFATNAGHLLGKKVVWTDHADLKYLMDRVNHRHPRMQAWLLSAAAKSNAILCVSKSEETSILIVAPELKSKLRVVYNGVFRPEIISKIPTKKFIIGTNARLVKEKGIAELIEAFAGLKKPNLELWLLGGLSGNELHYAGLAKKYGVENSVKFLDYVPNPYDYMASMDIFVHVSYHEAFSLALIEACMLARPIIATKVGGTPEIINEKTGILVPPKDSLAIQKALEKLIGSPELAKQLGRTAQASALNNFDFQKIVEANIIPIYLKEQTK